MMATTAKQPPRLAVQAFWLTASKFIAVLLNIGLPILLVRLMARPSTASIKKRSCSRRRPPMWPLLESA